MPEEKIKVLDTPVSDATYGMLSFYERHDLEKYGSSGGPLHDPTVIAYLLRPDLFEGKFVNVEIEIHSELTLGMSVVDWWGVTDRQPNVNFLNRINAVGFFELIRNRLTHLKSLVCAAEKLGGDPSPSPATPEVLLDIAPAVNEPV